jgi:hypothetical protein
MHVHACGCAHEGGGCGGCDTPVHTKPTHARTERPACLIVQGSSCKRNAEHHIHAPCHGVQAGRPKTVTGFQTHTTPVLLSVGERAELGTNKYLPLSSVLEGIVILKPNPDYIETHE